ncbi:helix-turn-helix domain-containing protein [Thiomicrorhabdus indica]|uniref:helix-turn-helix domain-containing protein n=1 Tax=Thiomicrorhabdus indica TaxID=2267253 RepID=UPI0039844B52
MIHKRKCNTLILIHSRQLLNQRGVNPAIDKIDKLCKYFNCRVEDLIEYVDESEIKN